MHGFALQPKTPRHTYSPGAGRATAAPRPVLRRSPIAERIQRIASTENPFEEDAVVVSEGSTPVEEEQVQTLRPAGQKGGSAGLSRGALTSAQGGAPLPPSVRQFMEPRFGADFSGVQVHADGRAAQLASSVSARAFAYGKHLYFNEGEYRPDTDGGKRVLAHELTHVLQQGDEPRTIRRMSPLGPVIKQPVAPWGGLAPLGANHEVTTSAGSVVTGWRGYSIFPYEHLFWCHGHSLGTMYSFGYSVYSGAPLATVLADEWKNIPSDQTRKNDIAVWTAKLNHSAIFSNPVFQNGQLDHQKSELTTKNGQQPLAVKTLADIEAVYGTGSVEVFRRK